MRKTRGDGEYRMDDVEDGGDVSAVGVEELHGIFRGWKVRENPALKFHWFWRLIRTRKSEGIGKSL